MMQPRVDICEILRRFFCPFFVRFFSMKFCNRFLFLHTFLSSVQLRFMLQIIDKLKFEEIDLIRVKIDPRNSIPDASPVEFIELLGFEEINLPWGGKILVMEGDGSAFIAKEDF